MARFVVIGQRATASPEFSLIDVSGTSGRLDVLLRCIRAAMLVSHGVRRDTVVYLVLLGGPRAPRSVRIDGASVKYLRPDERNLSVLLQKVLAFDVEPAGGAFVEVRAGISVAEGGLDAVLEDLGPMTPFVLEEGAPDVRDAALDAGDAVFFVGDHIGFEPNARARLSSLGARPIGVGPVSVQADDAIAILRNELDRRASRA